MVGAPPNLQDVMVCVLVHTQLTDAVGVSAGKAQVIHNSFVRVGGSQFPYYENTHAES